MGIQIYVDGSCDPHSKIGYGAALRIESRELRSLEELRGEVLTRRFQPCGSSSLELLAFLWVVSLVDVDAEAVTVFTDSQTMVGLPERRAALEAAGFCSRSGKELSQAGLYREFYDAMDCRFIKLVKLEGHKPKSEKGRKDLLFSLVDKASRSALRSEMKRGL